MTRGFGKRISLAALGAVLVLGSFVFKPVIVSAEKMDCCIYTVMPASNPPQWLTDLKDASMWFEDVAVGGKCKKSSEVVILATKKIDKYYNNNDGDSVTGDCSQTAEYKSFVAASAKTSCCEITNDKGLLRSCTAIDKAAVAKSEIASGCILASFKQFLDVPGGDKLIAHKTECTAVASCTALQKKNDDTTAANAAGLAKVQGADKAAAEAAKIVAAGGRPPWTKQECEDVKQKNSTTEPAFIWIPPKNDPAAQLGNYCFIRQIPTNLQVNIGSNSIISGLPDYINVMYKYALGIGVIVMIIVIMFSGIQWMLSGIASSINDSKERIKNASLGLLLLFGANTILYTVNPQLLNLKLPPMQAIRPEKFDVPVDVNKGTRCDPGDEDACVAKGANFKCIPTDNYAVDQCAKGVQFFTGIAYGAMAIAAAAPLIAAGSGLGGANAGVATTVANAGAGTVLRQVAIAVVQEGVEAVIDTATESSAGTAAGATVPDAVKGASKVSKVFKGVGAIAVVVGIAVAASAFLNDDNDDGSAKGYCIETKPEKPDYTVCMFDGQCQSGNCLLTSSSACGAAKYGVCTSGKLRQACLIPKSYSLGLFDSLSNKDAADKYKCNEGSCADNDRGAAKDGVGICSDGSQIGMPCNNITTCSSKLIPLECVRGFCREAGFFGTSVSLNGMMIDYDGKSPRCMLPTDCTDNKSQFLMQEFQKTISAGCIKGPSPSLDLPGRLLLPQINQTIDHSFYTELTTYGVCVTDKPYFIRYKDKTDPKSGQMVDPIAQVCYVNFYPTAKFDPHVQNIADYLATKNFAPTGKFAIFDIKKVGCGKEPAPVNGACLISPADIKGFASNFVNNKFMSIQGECGDELLNNAKTAIVQHKKTKEDLIGVGESDKWYSAVRIPNIVDLQYTSVGAAK